MKLDWGNSIADFRKHVERTASDTEHLVRDDISDAGRRIADRASDLTPVDTGKLRKGWKITHGRDGVDIVNNVPYAAAVESGTKKTAPRRMLYRAMEEGKRMVDRKLHATGRKMSTRFRRTS